MPTVAKTGAIRIDKDPSGREPNREGQKKHRGFFARLHEHKEKARHGFQVLKEHLGEETDETKAMLDIYHRSLEGRATKEEIHVANEQFKDLLRIAGMGTFFGLVPGSMLLLPLAIVGANRFGIRILPSSFVNKPTEEPEADKEGDEA